MARSIDEELLLGSARADPGVQWMLAYQGGDEAAFDRLVFEYAPRVYALLTRFLGSAQNREDLVQDVFLRVIRARESYVPEARFSTWLYRIAFNLCVNASERGSHVPGAALGGEEELDGLDERATAPPAELERDDRVRAVREALAALPARQRMALVLAQYEGLSHEEVAAVLGSSEKAIKSIVHRARENLRARLAPFLEEDLA